MVEETGRTQKPRPMGHLKVLNASHEKVWVIDTHGIPAMIDITHPGFLALAYTMDGQYSAARDAAMGKLSLDSLGHMFLSMGKSSAIEALKLPGLSLPLRMKTAIEAGYLKHALLCFQAISSGCRRPEAVVRLPEFRETLKERAPSPTKSPVSSGASPSPFAGASAPLTAPISLSAALSGDSIDWDYALRTYTQKKPKKMSVEVSRDVLQSGMALRDAAVEERMYNVADSAADLIIKHCDASRDNDLLIQLQTKLSAREHTKQLKDLVDLTQKSKKSSHSHLRNLTAAMLSGDPLVLSDVLQDLKMT